MKIFTYFPSFKVTVVVLSFLLTTRGLDILSMIILPFQRLFAPKCGSISAADVSLVSFYLSTPESNNIFTAGTTLSNPLTRQQRTLIDKSRYTLILLNGWLLDYRMKGLMDMKNEYIKCKDAQVIMVDWDVLSQQPYQQSFCKSRAAGKAIANFIISAGFDLSKVHVVGFSLGAQVAGFAGKQIQREKGQKLARITGVDPGGLGFIGVAKSERLNGDDAVMVDAIHTSPLPTGNPTSVGKVDFWPNGGVVDQPCCPFCALDQMWMYNFIGQLVAYGGCYHLVAMKYMTMSICTTQYKASYCTDGNKVPASCKTNYTVTFGENLEADAQSGNYHVTLIEKAF